MGGEIEDGLHLVAREAVVERHDFVDREAVFEILKNGGGRDAGATENPGAAEFPGDAFDRRTF